MLKIKIFFLLSIVWANLSYSAACTVFDKVGKDYPCLSNCRAIDNAQWTAKEIKKEVVHIGSQMYKKGNDFFELTVLQKEGGVVLGDMLCLYNNDLSKECTLESINIDPQYQKNGYGRLMVEYFKERAFKIGYFELSLYSLPDAVGFYKRLEFQPVGEIGQMTRFFCNLKETSMHKESAKMPKERTFLPRIDMPFKSMPYRSVGIILYKFPAP